MSVLLHIDCSPRRFERSISRQLTRWGVQAWRQSCPEGVVVYRDLTKTPLLPLGPTWAEGKDLPEQDRTEEQGFALAQSEELARELLRADTLVIGTPMHNYNLPAVLKLWFDHVILPGRTIRFTSSGSEGLVKASRAVVVIASGGNYEIGGHAEARDFETPYLDFVLRSIGVVDVSFVHAYDTGQAEASSFAYESFLRPLRVTVASLLTREAHAPEVPHMQAKADAALVTA